MDPRLWKMWGGCQRQPCLWPVRMWRCTCNVLTKEHASVVTWRPLPLSWRIQGLFELCARIACVTLLLQMQCHRHVWKMAPHRWCENNCVLLRFFASFYVKTQGRVGDVACPFWVDKCTKRIWIKMDMCWRGSLGLTSNLNELSSMFDKLVFIIFFHDLVFIGHYSAAPWAEVVKMIDLHVKTSLEVLHRKRFQKHMFDKIEDANREVYTKLN